MPIRTRKSSTRVTLVLIGAAAALSGCGSSTDPDTSLRRNLYASKEDCVADWGDAKECEQSAATSSGGRSGRVWFGPSYSFGSGTGAAASHSAHSIGSTSVSRGGFGASGHAHSSGGS
jgi:uncharacterized protein YgiB involved in biofilm formation